MAKPSGVSGGKDQLMVTVDEIRARVQAADEARIAVRAERAAEVAGKHNQLIELRAALANGEAAFKTSTAAALEVMSVDELAEFSGVPKGDVQGQAAPKATAVKARSTRSRKKPARQSETGAVAEPRPPADGDAAAE